MIRRFIGRAFAVIGFFAVVVAAAAGGMWLYLTVEREEVPALTVLELDLEAGVVETGGGDSLLGYAVAGPSLVELIETLRLAGADPRVKGLIARVGTTGGMGFGQLQEVRDAVRAFRDTGRFAIAYADSFSEFGPGTKAYYLASAFGEIWLQPSGNVGLTGLITEQPFLRQALDEFEIRPQLERRWEYKTAFNLATEAGFTKAHRESTQAMIDSLYRQVVGGIAEGRGLDPQAVRRLVDNGPYLGEEAFQAGLIDGLAYRDQVRERAREKAGGTEAREATMLELAKYRARLDRPEAEHAIALVHGVGLMTRGEGGGGPILGDAFMGADTVAKALRDAVEDDEIKAIVLRLDSGGGSYVAADTIRREVARAGEANKPVIVSMGDTAASGAYFVALPARTIVAEPGTITGSIGVIAGKVVTQDLWRRWGVKWESVAAGANAGMWSMVRPYDTPGRARLVAFVDHVYADFTAKVAEARGLSAEVLPRIARGRVWTGEDAKAHGLVDRLGGLKLAIDLAKQAGGIPTEAEVELRPFPEPKGLVERIIARYALGTGSSQPAALGGFTGLAERLGPWLERLLPLGDGLDGMALRMPALDLR